MWFRSVTAVLSVIAAGWAAGAQTVAKPAEEVRVQAIAAPKVPLPPEAESAGITKFSFIAYGDTRAAQVAGDEVQYEHGQVVNAMLSAIKRLEKSPYPVRFVLQSGDAVLIGREAKRWNDGFVQHINRLTQEGNVPYFFAAGNHDVAGAWDSAERKAGMRNTLDAVVNLVPAEGSQRRLKGYVTYAFGYGNLFVLALDSNIGSDEKQFEWVKGQLEGLDRKRYPHVIAFFHHPPFTSGPHGGARVEPTALAMRTRYLPLFRKHHVEMTIGGHEHLYEHWVERYEQGGKKYRRDDIVSGGGGAPIYWYNGEPDLTEYLAAGAAEKVSLEHLVKPGIDRGDNPRHFVIVRVDGDKMDLDVIGVDWGSNFQPYRSRHADLADPAPR